MSGFGAAFYDFDNDGWKDLFTTRGHVVWHVPTGFSVNEPNTVFRNLGASGKWAALTAEAGFSDATAGRNRGCAFGDFDGDGRMDVVTKAGVQYNHQTSSVCYASSSLGPVHFGLGAEARATEVEIVWPSGIVQTLENVDADRIVKVTETASTSPGSK